MALRDSLLNLLSLGSYMPPSDATSPSVAAVEARTAAPFRVQVPGFESLTWPWAPSVRSALGVPAILRAVTLISNVVGTLTMDAYRNGVRMTEAPSLVRRPNPLTTPRVFVRDTAFNLAVYGETWWNVAQRDGDGNALSLVNVPPREVKVEKTRDRLRPAITWNDRAMDRADMRQLTLMPDPDDPYRGVGPLQMCGAAISVSVESQQWASSFYQEGGYPSVYIRPDFPFANEDEAEKARQKWVSTPHNTPRIIEEATIGTLPFNEAGAQMLASREYQTGEAARMFGIPGTLLDHATPGSSLTYQNVGDEFDKFVRSCLWPNYLEPIEQEMSDLLTRSTIARFNLKALLRPDPKTRAEVYNITVPLGVQTVQEARQDEGLDPGDIETAPIPAAPPAAIPGIVPEPSAGGSVFPGIITRSAEVGEIRCDGLRRVRRAGIVSLQRCGKLLAEAGPFTGTCPRCKKSYAPVAA